MEAEVQESDITVTLHESDIKTIANSEILVVNGIQYFRKDFCIDLVVKFHQERTLSGRVKTSISKLKKWVLR